SPRPQARSSPVASFGLLELCRFYLRRLRVFSRSFYPERCPLFILFYAYYTAPASVMRRTAAGGPMAETRRVTTDGAASTVCLAARLRREPVWRAASSAWRLTTRQ